MQGKKKTQQTNKQQKNQHSDLMLEVRRKEVREEVGRFYSQFN